MPYWMSCMLNSQVISLHRENIGRVFYHGTYALSKIDQPDKVNHARWSLREHVCVLHFMLGSQMWGGDCRRKGTSSDCIRALRKRLNRSSCQ